MKPEPTAEEFADFPEWPYTYRTVVKRKVRGTKVEKAVIVVDTGTKIKPRQRHFFTTIEDARKKAKVMAKELKDGGRHNFSDQSDRFDALNALRMLRDRKAKESLTEAVIFLLERKYPKGGDAFVKDLATEFIREKDLIRKLSKTYKTSFHRIQVFGDCFVKPQSDPTKDPESYRCSEVTVELVLDYIYAHKNWKPETCRQHYRYFRMLFNFAVKKGWLHQNPLDAEHEPEGREGDPQIFSIDQVRLLVESAWAHPDPDIFPYVVLGLYGGIRPHEIQRLTWDCIRGNYEYVRIPARYSKTKGFRMVKLPQNAREMLVSHAVRFSIALTNEKILPGDFGWFKRRWRKMLKEVKLWPWIHDGMRHSFASYFLDATGNMEELMVRLGHSTPRTSLDHYVGFVDSPLKLWTSYFTIPCDDRSTQAMQSILETCTELDANNRPQLNYEKLKTFV